MSRWPRIPLSGSLRRTAPDRESTWKNREPSRNRNPGSRDGAPMKKFRASSSESCPRNWLTRAPTAVFSGRLQDRSATMVGGVLHWAAQKLHSQLFTHSSLLRSCLAFQGRTLFNHILNQSTKTCPQFVHLFFKFSNCAFRATTTKKSQTKFEESY